MDLASNASKPGAPPPAHPYYPLGVEVAGYRANDWYFGTLLAVFFSGVAVLMAATYALVKSRRPGIGRGELVTVMWFVLCGFIHTFFEGYYAYNFRTLAGLQDLFGQLWKEYAYSDSRYLTQDPSVWCLETITAVFWGPLCFTVAYMITTRHPLRYPLQLMVSLGQMYGDILYYATCLIDHFMRDISYSRPEAFYFWVYFVGANSFWIVIPACLIYSSVSHTGKAFEAIYDLERRGKADEGLKKAL